MRETGGRSNRRRRPVRLARSRRDAARESSREGGPLLAIDADIFVYQAVTDGLQEVREPDDQWTYRVDARQVKADLEARVEQLERELGARGVLMCFGSASNWRRRVLPAYKANRSWRKPLGYEEVVSWSMKRWQSLRLPFLEADDLVGLAATDLSALKLVDVDPGPVIIVSEDKDLLQVPGRLFNPRHPENGLVDVSDLQAEAFHMTQTLTGDSSDNYKGCPGVGPKKAMDALAPWLRGEASAWDCVVGEYERAGLTRDDALTQARVSRILRAGDYDLETGELRLWQPP